MAKTLIGCVLIAAVVFGAFAPVLRNGFTGYDDGEYVVENPHVRSGLSRENIVWAFTARHSNNWHPLTWISHAADSAIYGLNAWGHHLSSLVLHAFNAVLLFWWLYGVTGRLGCSALVALGFGLHPLHVESVAWVAERKDVLSTFFWILTLIAYTAWVRKRGVWRYLAVSGCLVAGLLSKQMLVTVPVLLLILDWWPLRREEPLRRLVIEKIPLLALAAIFSAAVIWVQRESGAVSSLGQLPLSLRLSNAVVSYMRYLGKSIWPVDLSVFYPFPVDGVAAWKVGAALVTIAAVSAIVIVLRVSRPWLATGWTWYLLTLLPVIGVVQVGMQAMADRYMYAPMIGLLIALIWEASTGFPRVAPYAGAVVLAAWALLAWRQIPVWKDGVTLFSHALAVNSNNFVAHSNLGVELDRRGLFEEALGHYRETLRIKPGDSRGETNYAHANFAKGERLIAVGKHDEALAVFREGLRYRPRHTLAHTHVGRILTQKQQIADALVAFDTALRIDPGFAPAHMGRAVAFAWSGRPIEARGAFEDVLRYDPRNVEAHYDLGLVLTVLGPIPEARKHFEAALALDPNFAPARTALAELVTTKSR